MILQRCRIARRLSVLSRLGLPTPVQPSIPSDGGHVTPRSHIGPYGRQRNLYRLCIVYACRLRLSSRLTLIRLALFRNPWAVGGGISIPLVVTHAYIFFSNRSRRTRRPSFSAGFNAPLPRVSIRVLGFGGSLDARSSSTRLRSTSELLRTL